MSGIALSRGVEPRNELKIPLQKAQFLEFRQALFRLGMHPIRLHPDRTNNTIYVDGPDLPDYFGNVSGQSRRSKTRFRWYNDDKKGISLEEKWKIGRASYKRTIGLDNPLQILPRTRHDLRAIAASNTSIKLMRSVRHLYPTCEVRYARSYFRLPGGIRMTVDCDQQFRRLHLVKAKRFVRSPVDYVVEFKFPFDCEIGVKWMLTGIPFRVFRHSKYVVGVDKTCG